MIRKATLTVILVLACLGTALAQTTLNSTTTSAALSVTGQVVSLTSVTNISADDGLFMDREFMRVQSCNTTALTCLVTRGQQGTSARAHASGVVVYSGAYQRFTKAVPVGVCTATAEEFLARVPEADAAMRERFDAARSRGKVLRYVGRLDADSRRATVGLVEVDRSHFLANMSLTDNLVSFTTSRYNRNPLVVRGPGAGPAVTAGGVFADLLRVCAYLGARL